MSSSSKYGGAPVDRARERPSARAPLRQLLSLDKAGAVVLPASTGFYAGIRRVEGLYGFIAGKVLDLVGVRHSLFQPWRGQLQAGRTPDQDMLPAASRARPVE